MTPAEVPAVSAVDRLRMITSEATAAVAVQLIWTCVTLQVFVPLPVSVKISVAAVATGENTVAARYVAGSVELEVTVTGRGVAFVTPGRETGNGLAEVAVLPEGIPADEGEAVSDTVAPPLENADILTCTCDMPAVAMTHVPVLVVEVTAAPEGCGKALALSIVAV